MLPNRDLHIKSRTLDEKSEVIRVLGLLGAKAYSVNYKYTAINYCHQAKDFMSAIDGDVWPGSGILEFNEFMEKYSPVLNQKIEQAKQQLGLTDKELSLKLGYGERYIARKLKTPPSEKTQELIIYRINKLLGESEVAALKKELEHKNQVLDKRNDLLADAEYKINALEAELNSVETLNQRKLNALQKANDQLYDALNEKIDHVYELCEKVKCTRALKKQILHERVAFGLFAGLLIVIGLMVWSL